MTNLTGKISDDPAAVTVANANMAAEQNGVNVKVPASLFATAAQGSLADTALQPDDVGTAAAEDVEFFATAAQGGLADTAVQPGDLGAVATSNDYDDLDNKPTLGNSSALDVGTTAGTVAAGDDSRITGAMQPATYDPTSVAGDAFDSANHVYDNTTSGMAATTTQDALDELGATRPPVVATRTALKALNTTVITSAYLKEAGREGQFVWRAGDYSALVTLDTTEALYIKADAIAASSGSWVRMGRWAIEGLDIRWHGADTAAGDNSAAIQACFYMSDILGLPVRLPVGTFSYATTLRKRQLTNIIGAGMLLAVLRYTGAGDGILVQPDTTLPDVRGFWKMADFSIIPSGSYTAGAGIRLYVDTTSEYISNFEIDRVYFGEWGTGNTDGSLCIDNPNANPSGIFSGTIRRCWFSGIRLRNAGDSLTIEENTITGSGPGIFGTLVDGARQLVIRKNNITNRGVGVFLIGVNDPVIENCWFEPAIYLGDFQTADIGVIYLEDCEGFLVRRCTIQGLAGAFAYDGPDYHIMAVESSPGLGSNGVIDDCRFGSPEDVDLFNTTKNLRVSRTNRKISGGGPITYTDTGPGTYGIYKTATLINSSTGSIEYFKGEDGLVTLRGIVTFGVPGDNAAILPSGFRPQETQRVICLQGSGTAVVAVQVDASTGGINVPAGAAVTDVSLDGLSFIAADA